eukprot:6207511-Pleurochrysis_carterae.AAC.1
MRPWSLNFYDHTCRWPGRLSPRMLGPSLSGWAGRREVPILGADPPRYTARAYTYVHRMHDLCAASNEWHDSVHSAALTVRLLDG